MKNPRHVNGKAAGFALAAVLGLGITGCAYGSSNGATGGGGNSQSAPGSAPATSRECGFTWDSCGPSTSSDRQSPASPDQPVASADAQEPGNFPPPKFPSECELYLRHAPTGITLYDGLNLAGQVQVACRLEPTVITVVLRLQYLHNGRWEDEATPEVDNFPPTLNADGAFRRDYKIIAVCYPGQWHLIVHWNGVKSDGHTGFPNPVDGDLLPDRTASTYLATC
jgi:hypothetical protein